MVVTPEQIRSTAIGMANEIGIINLKRIDLCGKLNIPEGSFTVIAGCSFTDLIKEIRPSCKTSNLVKPEKNLRTDKDTRIENILTIALDICEEDGFSALSRLKVAEKCGVSESLITYHFGNMKEFDRKVMRYAVQTERLSVIAQGIALRNPHALKASDELRARALESLTKEDSDETRD